MMMDAPLNCRQQLEHFPGLHFSTKLFNLLTPFFKQKIYEVNYA